MAMHRRAVLLAVLLSGAPCEGTRTRSGTHANPIRRVVSMLQMMQKKVTEEGARDAEIFDKFMCYCKTGSGDLGGSITAAEAKITQVSSSLSEETATKARLGQELSEHKQDRADAKEALASATAMREKEAAAFAKESTDDKTNIAALAKAITALEKGTASFLQSSAASVVQRLTVDMEMSSGDRDALSAFLSQGQGYVPQSGQIIGILKQMKETMEKGLAEATTAEDKAIADYEALAAAKTKEMKANTQAIEVKLGREAESGVQVVDLQEDFEDTTSSLAQDKKFLADLDKTCETRKAEWEAVKKTRADELLALAETIRILDDDDSLELFKKTLPSPSLLQTKGTTAEVKRHAMRILQTANRAHGAARDVRLDFLALAFRGQKTTFAKVTAMIDEMLSVLSQEQTGDDEKKAYCEAQLDKTEDEKKGLEQKASDLTKAAEEATGMIRTLSEEIAALEKGIKDLDASVAEATEMREAEHKEYTETKAADTSAKEVLRLATNRLNQFYNEALYKPPPKRELSAEDRIMVSMGAATEEQAPVFAQVTLHKGTKVAPPPPPAAVAAYTKKGQESNGVLTMIGMLAADLDKELQEIEVNEKDAQAEYEQAMSDSAAKRAADATSASQKQGAKADLEEELGQLSAEKKSTTKKIMGAAGTLKDLHLECDWLIANFETRKTARAAEVESLKDAKAILAGADYSL